MDPNITSRESIREERLVLLQAEGDASKDEQMENRRDGEEPSLEEFDEPRLLEEFELFQGEGDSLFGSSCSFSGRS